MTERIEFNQTAIDYLIRTCPEKQFAKRFGWFWMKVSACYPLQLTKDELRISEILLECSSSSPWFHGGPLSLPNSTILRPGHKLQHVYFSKSYQYAAEYAAKFKGCGAVYEVQPIGAIEADPEAMRVAKVLTADTGRNADEILNFVFVACSSFRAKTAQVLRRLDGCAIT